jgi:hypothetical protein
VLDPLQFGGVAVLVRNLFRGAFRGHPRRCAEICRATSYTYLNLCLSLEEPKCLHADSRWVTFRTGRSSSYPHTKGASPPALVELNLVKL